jgi:hypothetical protein
MEPTHHVLENMLPKKAWISTNELADAARVSPSTVRHAAATGQIPCSINLGGYPGKKRFLYADAAAWLVARGGTDDFTLIKNLAHAVSRWPLTTQEQFVNYLQAKMPKPGLDSKTINSVGNAAEAP